MRAAPVTNVRASVSVKAPVVRVTRLPVRLAGTLVDLFASRERADPSREGRAARSLHDDGRLRKGARRVDAGDPHPGAAAVARLRALLVLVRARRHLRRAHEPSLARLAVAAAALGAGHAALAVAAAGLDAPVAARVAGVELLGGEVERGVARVGARRRVEVD